ncbi:MAG: hypothetical protein ACHQNA_01145 [Acidimicrobiales bacterium]
MPPTITVPPARESRWLLVVSSKRDCRDGDCPTVVVIIFSAQVHHAGRHDELVRAGDGVERDSIAQTDLVMFWPKSELTDARFMGDVMRDTLTRVRARLANTIGISEPVGHAHS